MSFGVYQSELWVNRTGQHKTEHPKNVERRSLIYAYGHLYEKLCVLVHVCLCFLCVLKSMVIPLIQDGLINHCLLITCQEAGALWRSPNYSSSQPQWMNKDRNAKANQGSGLYRNMAIKVV